MKKYPLVRLKKFENLKINKIENIISLDLKAVIFFQYSFACEEREEKAE